MRASGKQPQHARCISMVYGLAQDFSLQDDDCVRAQHIVVRILRRNRFRFFPRQPQRICDRRLAWRLVFIDVRCMHLKRNADFAQEFLPSR